MSTRRPLLNLLSLLLFAIYILSCMMLLIIGIRTYRSMRDNGEYANEMRLSLGYVANKLRSEDRQGAVFISDRAGIETLVIRHDYEIPCETHLYFCDGALYESFVVEGAETDPLSGTRLAAVKAFGADVSGDKVRISVTDMQGISRELNIKLRSGKETGL